MQLETPGSSPAAATASNSAPDYVIDASQLVKTFNEGVEVRALRGVDLQVERGSFLAIMGPSGSGKSTLLNILGGLEPANSGRLVIEGIEIASASEYERTLFRRRRIGFIFQQFNLLSILTAGENVAVPLRLEGKPIAEAAERAEAMLRRVGLEDRVHQLPSRLSGGEQQRVAVARALVTRPAIILADEPTGSLDSANGERIITLLREIVDELGQTVVMVTHDAAVAARADRIVSMRDGRIANDHAPNTSPAVDAATGGRP